MISAGIREAIGSDISVLKLSDLDRHESKQFANPLDEDMIQGLNQHLLTQDLEDLKSQALVQSFSFVTPEFKKYVKQTRESRYSKDYGIKIKNIKGDSIVPEIYGVDEDLLESISYEFYYPVSENVNYEYEKLKSGDKNAVKKMVEISNKNTTHWKQGKYDPENILAYKSNIKDEIDIETFNIVIPESLKWLLSFDAGNDKLDVANL